MHVKATIEMEATYFNDKISNWEPLIELVMVREDVYRPWSISLWFAIEEGGILQPPLNDKGLQFIEFPVKDLDYSVLKEKRVIPDEPLRMLGAAQPMESPPETMVTVDMDVASLSDLEAGIINEAAQTENLGNASYITIESNDLLNLNITPSAYKVLFFEIFFFFFMGYNLFC